VATLPSETPDLPLKTVVDVADALAATINQVRRGEIGVSVGNCIGVLATALLKALDGGDIEKRLAALEVAKAAGSNHG
jgi:hypothetical protein